MKYQLFLAILSVIIFDSSRVEGVCYVCQGGTNSSECRDQYVPPGPEIEACSNPTDGALCRKYNGSYSIYCTIGSLSIRCTRTATPCPGKAEQHTPSPGKAGQHKALWSLIATMSLIVVIVTRNKF